MKFKDYRKLKNFPKEKILEIEEANDLMVVERNGERVEMQGPWCTMCGAHMGLEYHPNARTRSWQNPHKHDNYGTNKCHACGQKYEYIEGDQMLLSKEDMIALRKLRGLV